MNPQVVYHAYAMSYLELDRARAERRPVPTSVVARLATRDRHARRAVMWAFKDVERLRPMRSKPELLACIDPGASESFA